MKGEDGALYHYILPSFFKLLHHLQQTRRDHAVVIRTYGQSPSPGAIKPGVVGVASSHQKSHENTVKTSPTALVQTDKNVMHPTPQSCRFVHSC